MKLEMTSESAIVSKKFLVKFLAKYKLCRSDKEKPYTGSY